MQAKRLDSPVAEAMRRIRDNEPTCNDCDVELTEEEVLHYSGLCKTCYDGIDIFDYNPERPK